MNSDFHCKCCGACCRIPDGIVRISDDEIARIAQFLGMDEATFIANETLSRKAQNYRATKSTRVARRVETRERAPYPDRRGLILKNTPEGVCVYLTSDNLCRINPLSRKAQNRRATKSTRVARRAETRERAPYPDKCRTFPFEWINADSTSVCPELKRLASAGVQSTP